MPAIVRLLSVLTALTLAACLDSHVVGGGGTDASVGPDLAALDIGSQLDLGVDQDVIVCVFPGRPAPILPPSSSCRSDLDCASGQACTHPDLPFCGGGAPPPPDCLNGGPACTRGSVCVATQCGQGICVTDCRTAAGACPSNASCDTRTGGCVQDACRNNSSLCPPDWTCSPGGFGADSNGCMLRGCTMDSHCLCGACVNGQCASQLGVCELPRP